MEGEMLVHPLKSLLFTLLLSAAFVLPAIAEYHVIMRELKCTFVEVFKANER